MQLRDFVADLFGVVAKMHTRYPGESTVAYLTRVEQDMAEDARRRRPLIAKLLQDNGRPPSDSEGSARPDLRSDFWMLVKLLTAQNNRCYWCCRVLIGEKFHVDHVYPRSRGGSDDLDNLRVSCVLCNLSKNATLPADYAIELLR